MKKVLFLSAILSAFLGSALIAQPSPQAEAAIFKYTATLLGANESPTADPTAVGFAEVTADTTTNTVSWAILAPDLANVSASHIHRGGPTVGSGTIVIPFNAPFTNGLSSGSATITPALMSELVGNPGGFYVNVHNTAFPGGAIRGQLMPAPLVAVGSCGNDRNTLCLNQGRFKVQVAFQTAAANGVGVAIPFTDDTGAFWFFSSNNLELMIKVVDGRAVNQKFWFFAGALSDVAYTITVTDLTTSTVKTYVATQGHQAAINDTSAF